MVDKDTRHKIVLDIDPDINEENEDSLNLTYKWRLREVDTDGNQVGDDYQPCDNWMIFTLSDLRSVSSLEIVDEEREKFFFIESVKPSENAKKFQQKISRTRSISGKLSPIGTRFLPPVYSLLGSNQRIEDINLEVQESDSDLCFIRGGRAFQHEGSSFPNSLSVVLRLSPERFSEFWNQATESKESDVRIGLRNCEGFYSYDSYFGADEIKVLLRHQEEHKVHDIPDGFKLPRLGAIGEVKIQFADPERKNDIENDDEDDAKSEFEQIKDRLVSLEKLLAKNNEHGRVIITVLISALMIAFVEIWAN